MRTVFTIASHFIVALFLLFVVTPEPYYLPGCQNTAGVLTVVDDDDFTLCSGFTVVSEDHHRIEYLYLAVRAWAIPSPFITRNHSRAPPSYLSTIS